MTPDEKRFEVFLREFEPRIAEIGRAAVARLQRMLPSAEIMIYDNYNFLVAGFSPNDRASDAVLSVALAPRSVALCFLQGAELPDPNRILRGNGKVVRNVRLESVDDLDRPEIAMLLDMAIANSRVAFDDARSGRLYVKSVSPKKRPRRLQKTGGI